MVLGCFPRVCASGTRTLSRVFQHYPGFQSDLVPSTRPQGNAPCCLNLRCPHGLLAQAAYTQRWPNLSPNGWEAKRVGGTHPGALCATLVSSRGPLETWEFPVGPGCPQRRPAYGEPTSRLFSTMKERRGCDGTRRTKPRAKSCSRNGAPGPRKKQQPQQ